MTKETWTVKLRADQMDCVIETLRWVIKQQEDAIPKPMTALERFSMKSSKARLEETLAVFTDVGHRV